MHIVRRHPMDLFAEGPSAAARIAAEAGGREGDHGLAQLRDMEHDLPDVVPARTGMSEQLVGQQPADGAA